MNPKRFGLRILAVIALAALPLTLLATELSSSNSSPGEVLLLDSLGHLVKVPTNELPAELHPPSALGLKHQIPNPTRGARQPDAVQQRTQEGREGMEEIHFFPSVPAQLMPYLASQDEYGNTAVRPGALIPFAPLEPEVQGAKYWLSEYGLRYSLQQTYTYVSMSDVKKGDHTLSYYTFDYKAKWAVFNAPGAGNAGWITTQVEAKSGLSSAGENQSAKSNLGTVTDPTGIWSSHNGWRVPELGWQQSLDNGKWVAVAGMISQGNYFDANAYAGSGRGQFINSALIDTMVMPLANYNFGVNLQWQPVEEWYAMIGSSAGNATAGLTPWTDFSWDNWSLIGELGYAPADFFGLGNGIYRIQPFLAQADGPTQGGLCFNLQQQLGHDSPLGWYGRFGFGGDDVSAGASAQIGTGFVMSAPLKHAGLVPKLSSDLFGVGFVWSQPASTTKTVYHENEYTLETFYTLQLTPTMKLQPDLQVVWDPAFNGNADHAIVGQIQFVMSW